MERHRCEARLAFSMIINHSSLIIVAIPLTSISGAEFPSALRNIREDDALLALERFGPKRERRRMLR